MKQSFFVDSIDWDTDGEVIETLPKQVLLEFGEDEDIDDTDIADELSDRYGFCVNGFYCERVMPKRALLVTFSITTRVVVEEGDDMAERAVDMAVDNVRSDYESYIIGENVVEMKDDLECPYGVNEHDIVQ